LYSCTIVTIITVVIKFTNILQGAVMVVCKEGYRFIQGLIPAKMHKEITRISRELGQSRAETLRNAIALFLENTKSKTVGNVGND
jgi:hypothetical protein